MKELLTILQAVLIRTLGRRPWKHLLLVSAAIGLQAGGTPSHQDHTSAPPDLPPVHARTQVISTKPVIAVEEVVGTVRAKLRATMEARMSGRIVELPLVLGQKIRTGDRLARLDAPEIQARLEQAEAGLQ